MKTIFAIGARAAGRHVRQKISRGGGSMAWASAALVAVAALAVACGDGATEPPPPDPPRPATVTVTPATVEFTALDATVQLAADVRDQHGQAMAGATVTWSSSAAAVATVDASGLVTAVGNGTATITASAASASGMATVTVAQSPDSVAVLPAEATITALGDTLRLAAEALDANGQSVAGVELAWESSDDAVATVDASGLVTAVGNGTAAITASAASASGMATVTVAQSPDSVAVLPAEATITALGDTLRLAAEALDANGQSVADVEFAWESSDDAVATVDASGLVTAAGNGTAAITASAGSASGMAAVTVMQVPDSVAVLPAEGTIAALGDTLRLTAEALDANGQSVAGAEFAWESSDDAVATVDASGLVTAAGNGMATITASAGEVTGSATVAVVQEVGAVAIAPTADTLVAFGDTVRFSAEAQDANGHPMLGAMFDWTSGDTLVATVDSAGLATAVAAGEAEVTATSAGVTGVAQLTVVAPVATTVAVSPDTVAFTALGQTALLASEVRDQVGRPMADVAVAWASGDTTVAVVGSAGLVTAVGYGATIITAMAGEASATAIVTVTLSADSVTVSPAADTVAVGDTVRLSAEGFDEDGHPVDGAVFTWSSSDATVATVDTTGLLTGVAEGVATVTATSGSARGTAEITVKYTDRAVLVALYNATDGENWVNNENWLTDAPLGEWFGVTTNREGRVVALEMAYYDRDAYQFIGNNVSGPIPPALGKLANLRLLNFTANDLSGAIPPEVGDLAKLTILRLYANNLSGPIPPELGNLGNLTWLFLGDNELTGSIPPELGGLANLTRLLLGGNQLSGLIPPELGNLANLELLYLNSNGLTGPIPAELGNLANLESLHLYSNDLAGPIPAELSDLADLTWLWLGNNQLTGRIPSELGNLGNLRSLHLYSNDLSGPIPAELAGLANLRWFYFQGNEGLCAPGIASFADWLLAMEQWAGPYCNESDVGVLETLFESLGGSGWTNSDGWLGGAVLAGWHGVRADSLGRVTGLDLSRNGLAGRLPGNLGELVHMTELRIADNADLSGRLPLALAGLSLQTLHYSGTDLCAPVNTPFRDWLRRIPSHDGTGVECPPLSDREGLEALYHATGGPDWIHNENWLTDAPLGEWYGIDTDDLGRVVAIGFLSNGLRGRIPVELGDMAHLQSLRLNRERLTGPVPPELGGLANLRSLSLGENNLTGPIPPELGGLANLRSLLLHENDLTGSIPSELGNLADLGLLNLSANRLAGPVPRELGGLANLFTLYLGRNELAGPIPPELGGLANLLSLNFATNRLSGRIPAELGGLTNLRSLYLGDNELTGPLPPEFAGLTRLRTLALQANANMSGPLPSSLINLAALETLQTGGTSLCAPSDAEFLEWLKGVANRRVVRCEGEPAMAYLVQAVQSRDFPAPLVAGEEALLRVFVTASRENTESLPPVQASFHLNGALVHVADIPAGPGPIPTEVDEGSLAMSVNAVIPAEVVQPGLEMVVEVDPDGTLDAGLGMARQIPDRGRAAVDVRTMPVFDLTLVPFLWTEDPDSAVLVAVGGMAGNPEEHELLELTRTLLPVGDLTVTAHEAVLSSSNHAYDLLAETRAIRVMEGATGYYMGTMSGRVTGAAGLAGGVASFAVPRASVIAHEFGHNFGLPHAPCGGADNPDPAYPTPDGTIGAWGYDFQADRLVPPSRNDIMGYCTDDWISDYFFTKALHHRLASESAPPATVAVAEARSLLLWGGADSTGTPHLKPAFIVDAPAALPDSAGPHRITGRTADGAELFSLSFTMPETADGNGSSAFAFALPVRSGWARSLASITFTSPGGSFTLSGDSDVPMAILRDPRTGQIRGILRDLPPAAQVAMDAAGQAGGPAWETLFSRGIPGAEAWRR